MANKTNAVWPPKLPAKFPLSVTKWGYVKTIGGKTHWICGKKTPTEAKAIYYRKAADLAADRDPLPVPVKAGGRASIHYILTRWINARELDLHDGNLKAMTFAQYRRSAKRIDKLIGHHFTDEYGPDMTQELYRRLAKSFTEDSAKRSIGHWRDCCRYAEDREWCHPIRIGENIVRKIVSRPRPEMKWKLPDLAELHRILAAAKARIAQTADRADWRHQAEQFYAMLLLSLNGGYGGMELAEMTKDMVNLQAHKISGKRGKTGATHVCPLWPETVAALDPVLRQRPDDPLVFRTRQGHPWVYYKPKMKGDHAVSHTGNDNFKQRWDDLVKPMGLKVKNQGPYKLRHLHATTADRFGDTHAVNVLMGHKLPGAKGHYIQVGEDRLRKLVDFIRQELILNRPDNRKEPSNPRASRKRKTKQGAAASSAGESASDRVA